MSFIQAPWNLTARSSLHILTEEALSALRYMSTFFSSIFWGVKSMLFLKCLLRIRWVVLRFFDTIDLFSDWKSFLKWVVLKYSFWLCFFFILGLLFFSTVFSYKDFNIFSKPSFSNSLPSSFINSSWWSIIILPNFFGTFFVIELDVLASFFSFFIFFPFWYDSIL